MNQSTYKAPRFQAYLEKAAGRPLLLMLRTEWKRLKLHTAGIIAIDLRTTPLARLALEIDLEAAVAERRSTGQVTISIYRRDPKDAPTPINQDVYSVWESLPDRLDISSLVIQASTADNPNFRGFLREHVFLVKERPGPDHWLEQLPVEVWAVVNTTKDKPA